MTDRLTLSTVFVVLVALTMATSPVAMAAGGTIDTVDDSHAEINSDALSVADEQLHQSTADSADSKPDRQTPTEESVEIDRAVAEAEGTIEVLVRVDEVDLPLLEAQTAGDTVSKLKAHAAESQEPVLEYVAETDGLETLNTFWVTNAVLVEVDTAVVDVTELAAQPGVDSVHENYQIETPEPMAFEPATASANVTYGLDQINATEVWEAYDTKGDGASVAVLDTGVDPTHPDIDIDPANWAEFDQSGDQVDSDPHDSAYHGTHVSGTVTGGNASGTHIGVAPGAELYHGLVLPEGGGSFAQIIAGMEWAVNEDVDVISMSLGAEGYHGDLVEPVRNAYQSGTVVVSSSGNSGADTSGSPGNIYEAFAVGMSNEAHGIDADSSGEVITTAEDWGVVAPDDWPDEYVVPDVSAPGVDVMSAIPEGTIPDNPDATYGYATGTSMAAPHVSGAIALVIAGSGTELDGAQSAALFESTAWKPDGEPEEQDTRYGHGLIDAKAAIDRLAADSGVEGNVTSDAGQPVGDATVTLDGYPVYTDADGTYRVHSAPGEYPLETDAFGYEANETTVTVSDGQFTTQNIELNRTLAVELADAQPRNVQAGDSLEVTFDVAHLESYQVNMSGYDAANASLTVDGQDVAFGDTITFDEPVSGPVTVSVTTSADSLGSVELNHTFEGMGDEHNLTTGPTGVFDEPVDVGVVAPEGQTVTTVQSYLEEALDIRFEFTALTLEEAIAQADSGSYDSYVVQSLGTDAEQVEAFVDATKTPELGVVYLEQMGEPTDAISNLAATTDDPREVGTYSDTGTGTINYEIDSGHPIFEGVAAEGDTVELYTPQPVGLAGYFHSFFEDYEGHIHSEKLASTSYSGYFLSHETGTGMAVENNSRTVLAASLTPSQLVTSNAFSSDAAMILENSVAFASETPPAYIDGPQTKRIDPGTSTTVKATAENLDSVSVDVAEGTLSADNLSLFINGTETGFGEAYTFDNSTDVDALNLTVATDDVVGNFGLEATFDTVDEQGASQSTTVKLGTTAVYEPPLEVPSDVETLAEAVEIVPEDGEIVLDDGEYADSQEIADFTAAAYVLETPGVTIRAADGADPVVNFEGDAGFTDRVFEVRANGITLSDLRINVAENGTRYDGLRAIQNVGYDNVTVENVTVGGDRVIFFSDAESFTVRDTEITDTGWSGIQTRIAGQDAGGGLSEDVVIDNVTVHEKPEVDLHGAVQVTESTDVTITNSDLKGQINLDASADVTVTNNTVDAHGLVGIDSFYTGDVHVAENTVNNASTAVNLAGIQSSATAVDNTINNSKTGMAVSDSLSAAEISHNEIAAETGIQFRTPAGNFTTVGTETEVYYNDLSGSDLAFGANATVDGAMIDVRYNYLGDDRPAVDGNLVYEPYLTDAPTDEMPSREAVTSIGVDTEFEAGAVTAVGVPGPTTQTVADLFADDFDGVVYGFDAEGQSWDQLTGTDKVSALDALMVVAETDGYAQFEFSSGELPPGPGQTSLTEGWNFVAAPTYDGVESAFEHATTDVGLAMHITERPTGQIAPAGELDGTYVVGGDDPRVSPFEGYFVWADGEGRLPAHLASDPTTAQLYDSLGAEAQLEQGGGDVGQSISVEKILASELDGEARERALVATVHADLRAALDDNATTEDALTVIDTVTSDALADAGANEALVEDATWKAATLLLSQEFGLQVPPQASDDAGDSRTQPRTVAVGASG